MKNNQFTPSSLITSRDHSSFKVRELKRDSAFGNRPYAFLENFCLASRQASPLKFKFDQFDRSFGGKKFGVVTFSVLVALGSIFSPAESFAFPASLTQNGDEWTFGVDSGFTVVTDPNQRPQYTVLSNPQDDPFDNSLAWIWSYSTLTTESSSTLNVTISKTQSWNHESNGHFVDNSYSTIWIAGGLQTDFGKTKEEIGALTGEFSTGNYSKTTNGNTLSISLEENVTFMGKFFGSRNDIGGGVEKDIQNSTYSSVGEATHNSVLVKLAPKSKLYAKLIFGGRSAQLDAIEGSEVTFNGVTTTAIHKGFKTNNNQIFISGSLSDSHTNANDFVANEPDNASLLITKGIFGGEGYESSDNLVSVKDTLLVAGSANARKLGLVGGRGVYYMRINQVNLPNADNSFHINNSLVWDGNAIASNSAIANHNVVTIENSYIGYKVSKDLNDWDPENLSSSWRDSNQAFSIYGGWSTGLAANNIVSIKNSTINGNVIGGLELLDRLSASASDLRELSPNLVSLFNVKLEKGSAVYGTSTAEGEWETTEGVDRVKESSLKAVNRRRGVVYLSGENEVDSVYARYVHFGQYVENSILEKDPNTERNISRDYYPTSDNYQAVLDNPNYVVKDSAALKRITSTNSEAAQYSMRLGDLVAKSYVINRTGFHSSPTSRDSSNVSDETNGLHNFWVGSYVNLVKTVNGDGANFNKNKQDLFQDKAKYVVNHSYGTGDSEKDRNLSLLVHDDGMIYSYVSSTGSGSSGDSNAEHRPALMHNFRYHYDGLVLYTGVNTGLDADGNEINAVAISFDQIEQFRQQSKQNLNAFGNTFVGVFLEGNPHPFFKPSFEHGYESVSASEMTFEPTTINGSSPFEISQSGRVVAFATYGFYKYMHFDGEDGLFSDPYAKDEFGNLVGNVSGKLTKPGESGGVGVKYWLKSLDLVEGETLLLNGALDGSDLGETESIRLQERFTLSAELKGKGNLAIGEKSTVILGSPKTIYTIDSVDVDGGVIYHKPIKNSFTGLTMVEANATLISGIDGALGSSDKYTCSLQLEEKAAFYLQKHVQDIGHLNVETTALLDLSNEPKLEAISNSNSSLSYSPDWGESGGVLIVHNTLQTEGETVASVISGNIQGSSDSALIVDTGRMIINSENTEFHGDFELRKAAGLLNNSRALDQGRAILTTNSSLYFNSASASLTRGVDPRSEAHIRAIQNAGDVFLSSGEDKVSNLNHVNVAEDYEGDSGSVIHYRGLVQGANNSYVDVIHSDTASGTSKVSFGDDHSKIPVSGIFKEARGEKTLKSEGIPIFVIADKGIEGNQLRLEMQPFGVVAKDNEAYKWIYRLGYNDEEQGSQRTWVLYNSDDKGHYEPLVPPKEEENLVLRPEAGAYVGASQSWAKMHMRLHDRFGQAYYIDPFDGEEKPAAAWVRQVGSHSHFRMAGGQSKTHSNTAVTQIGGDLLRNEFNEDWKYIGGVFAGGLYNRSDSRSWDSAKSRSDGYSLGIYGTLYTGNSPDDGFYVDSWLLFGRYDNKIWSDEISPFKFKSHGWVWSVETGYTIPIGESGSKDYNKLIWTFQPEAQLVWDGVKANSANDSFGTKYRQLGTDNVTLRVGARLHANYMNKGLGFIEGNWIHNSKKAGVQMGTDKIYMDGGRNLGEFRMGLEGHLSRNTLGWATVGVQAGKSGYHNETAQIGIKYMF